MSGECDKCGNHCLECKCTLTNTQESDSRHQENHLQCSLNPKIIPFTELQEYPLTNLKVEKLKLLTRKEQEEIIKDINKCREIGVDQDKEMKLYLERWGSWLDHPPIA